MKNHSRDRWHGLLVCLVLLAAVATLAPGHATEEKAPPADSYRLELREVLRHDDARVIEVSIETGSDAWIEIKSDQPDRGGLGAQVQGGPKGSESRPRARLVILGDRIQAGSADSLKFLMSLASGAANASSANIGPMPQGKRLADVLKLNLEPGVHRFGEKVPVVVANDVSYTLVVQQKPGAGK